MAKKCGVFVISNKLFFHRHFALFLDYNPVGLHAYVGVLLTVNHWFLSLQYAFARVRRFHVLLLNIFPIFPFSHFPNGKWCFYISYYISIYYLFYYIYFSLYGKMGKWRNGNFWENVTLCVAVVYLRESVGDGVEVGRSWIIYPPDRF